MVTSQSRATVAAAAPDSWAAMKRGAEAGAIPAKVFDKLRATVSRNLEESSMQLTARTAEPEDAFAVTEIYNQGIEDRIATFETRPRDVSDILPWFRHAYAFVSVTDGSGEVVGYAVAHPYAETPWYRGIGAFSVYVRRSHRGRGVGQVAMVATRIGAQIKTRGGEPVERLMHTATLATTLWSRHGSPGHGG